MSTIIRTRKLNETHMMVTSEKSVEMEMWEFFSFQVPGYKFMRAYKLGVWDGFLRNFNLNTKRLYIGLRDELQRFADENGYEVEDSIPLVEPEFSREEIEAWLDTDPNTVHGKTVEMRDYQRESIIQAIIRKRMLLVSPTSSGKSFFLYKVCKFLLLHGKKILLQVPSTMLVEQMYKDFEDYATGSDFDVGGSVQRIYSGYSSEITHDMAISTWQTQHSKSKKMDDMGWYFNQFDVIIQDECLAGDTLIKTPTGDVAIKDIKVGDKIINYCEKNHIFKEDKVVKVHVNLAHTQQEKMLELKMDNGSIIQVTANHKFLTTDGWVRADCLDENHQIISTSI